MFGINQTSTQDSNVLTIFQTTYWGVDLVIIVSYIFHLFILLEAVIAVKAFCHPAFNAAKPCLHCKYVLSKYSESALNYLSFEKTHSFSNQNMLKYLKVY